MSPPDGRGGVGRGGVRKDDDKELVDVFRTSDITLLPVVKAALESAGIPFAVQGEEGLHQIPIPFGAGFFRRVLGAVIRVPKDRAEEAKAFLASFETDPPRLDDECGSDEEPEETPLSSDDSEEPPR